MHKREKKKLEKVFDEFYDYLAGKKVWLAGGAITSLFTNTDINDFDVYFSSNEELLSVLEDLDGSYTVMSHTNKATLLVKTGQMLQIIRFKYFETAEDIFDTFDFTVCMGAYSFEKEEFVLHPEFMKHNAQNVLSFNEGTAFPYISMLRVDKYNKKGYRISKPELSKIMLAISQKPIESYEDAQEQLGGMYGNNIANIIDKDQSFSIESLYELLSELDATDSHFDMPDGMHIDAEELIELITEGKFKMFEIDGKKYKIVGKKFKKLGGMFPDNSQEKWDEMLKSGAGEVVDTSELYNVGDKLYKYVGQDKESYFSIHKKHFKYKLGEIVDGGEEGIWNLDSIDEAHYYKNHSDSVLIEMEIVDKSKVVSVDSNTLRFDKLKFVKVLDKNKIEDIDDEDFEI